MTTRPGYVWDDNTSEWVEIGQAAVVAPISYQASAPSTPSTGDIWIDSDDEVPSVDSTLYYRWTKTMSGGETSLSGTDNNSLSLQYTPGYESVFINGVLQVRNLDYTATSGSTISGLTALASNDIVMVESIIAYSVGDTYTQTTLDGKFATQVDFPAGAWISYTPTLTNGSVGNGTLVADYVKIGKTVIARIKFTLGSTSTIANEPWFSLPLAKAVDDFAFIDISGNTYINDNGTSLFSGPVRLRSDAVQPMFFTVTGTKIKPDFITSTLPMTWTTNDQLALQVTYEAA
jgi:hypothetical protein